jgi:hypothetical protein
MTPPAQIQASEKKLIHRISILQASMLKSEFLQPAILCSSVADKENTCCTVTRVVTGSSKQSGLIQDGDIS